MNAERVPEREQKLRLVGAGEGDAISAWLGVLVRVLRVPAKEAEGIRDELESHLRERVRDLEVTGVGEEDAERRAVSELGDAAAVARRYRAARAFPRRRLMMNLSMIAVAGVAVVGGVVALSQPGESSRVSVFSPPEQSAAEQGALSKKLQIKFEETELKDVFAFASQAAGIPVNVTWGSLEEEGMSPETPVTLSEQQMDLRTMVRAVSDQLSHGSGWVLDYRVADGKVQVATDQYFDRRETVLASYDLSGLEGTASSDDVRQLIETFVHPNGWEDNGGDIARVHMVGNKMFVQAPKRYHAEIKWFIEELAKDPGQAGVSPEAAAMRQEIARAREAKAAVEEKAHADEQAAQAAMSREQVKRTMDELAMQRAAMDAQREVMAKQHQDQAIQVIEATRRAEDAARTAEIMAKQRQDLEDQAAKLKSFSDDLQVQSAKEKATHEVQVQAMQMRIEELSKRAADLERAMKDAEERRRENAQPAKK